MLKLSLAALLWPAALSADTLITIAPSQLDWEETPEGVTFAELHGSRFEEAYMAMVALPPGLVSPTHRKSEDMFGLVVSGAMTHVPADTDPMSGDMLHAGAYYHIPADLAHVSSCLSSVPCVTFLYQPGAFDFRPEVAQ